MYPPIVSVSAFQFSFLTFPSTSQPLNLFFSVSAFQLFSVSAFLLTLCVADLLHPLRHFAVKPFLNGDDAADYGLSGAAAGLGFGVGVGFTFTSTEEDCVAAGVAVGVAVAVVAVDCAVGVVAVDCAAAGFAAVGCDVGAEGAMGTPTSTPTATRRHCP